MNRVVCRHFKGDRPCKYYWIDRSYECDKCPHNSPIMEHILIIKLDAIGDVLRATPLAAGLKKKYPNSFLTWLVGAESYDLLKDTPYIDRVVKYNQEGVDSLSVQKFDILINLDKAPHAAALAMRFDAKAKFGYGLDEKGFVFPLNKGAEYHYSICLDNWGKKTSNDKNYQEMIFMIAGLKYNGEEYSINVPKQAVEFAKRFLEEHNVSHSDIVIGLNTGCGPVFPHKKWTFDGYSKLIEKLVREINAKVILFGSKPELEYNAKLYSNSDFKDNIINATGATSITELAALIGFCDVLVTGDTAGMHIAIALKKPVVALFGPTPSQEINIFGRGIKLVGKVDCINCYDQFECKKSPTCMETITPEEVFDSILSIINK
ncbi:MAG: glycosyltransferase family 9 protein [Candidatus Nanoarchaeia archaeon]